MIARATLMAQAAASGASAPRRRLKFRYVCCFIMCLKNKLLWQHEFLYSRAPRTSSSAKETNAVWHTSMTSNICADNVIYIVVLVCMEYSVSPVSGQIL